jgi:hypothetical protein
MFVHFLLHCIIIIFSRYRSGEKDVYGADHLHRLRRVLRLELVAATAYTVQFSQRQLADVRR